MVRNNWHEESWEILSISREADSKLFVRTILNRDLEVVPPDLFERITWAVGKLSCPYQQVVIRFFGLDNGGLRTIRQIAQQLNMKESQVKNLKTRGLRRLRFADTRLVLEGISEIPRNI